MERPEIGLTWSLDPPTCQFLTPKTDLRTAWRSISKVERFRGLLRHSCHHLCTCHQRSSLELSNNLIPNDDHNAAHALARGKCASNGSSIGHVCAAHAIAR